MRCYGKQVGFLVAYQGLIVLEVQKNLCSMPRTWNIPRQIPNLVKQSSCLT